MKPPKPEQHQQYRQKQGQANQGQLECTARPRTVSNVNEGQTSGERSTSPATVKFADVSDNCQSNDDTVAVLNVDDEDEKDNVDSSTSRDLIHIQRGHRYRSPPPPVQSVALETNDEDAFGATYLETDVIGGNLTGNNDSVVVNEHVSDGDQVLETTKQDKKSFSQAVSVTSCRLSDDSGVVDGGLQRDDEHSSTTADHVTSGGDEPEAVNSVASARSRSNSSVSDGSVLAAVSIDERPTIVAPLGGDSQNCRRTTTIVSVSEVDESGMNGTEQRKKSTGAIKDMLVLSILADYSS